MVGALHAVAHLTTKRVRSISSMLIFTNHNPMAILIKFLNSGNDVVLDIKIVGEKSESSTRTLQMSDMRSLQHLIELQDQLCPFPSYRRKLYLSGKQHGQRWSVNTWFIVTNVLTLIEAGTSVFVLFLAERRKARTKKSVRGWDCLREAPTHVYEYPQGNPWERPRNCIFSSLQYHSFCGQA